MEKEILEFYKKTSSYTDLGYYKEFAKNLSNDIKELCILQRQQIIHPVDVKREKGNKNSFYGDMNKVPNTRLTFEDDIFPTAQAVLSELLRKDEKYSIERKIEDKVHVTCRCQAILLAAILKAKDIPARARSGFTTYVHTDGVAYDHWITEYFDYESNKWRLTDADMTYDNGLDFDINDIPYDKFIFGADVYLGLRNKKYSGNEIAYASDPYTYGMPAAIRGLMYDFHALMNDEIIFLHMPKYIRNKNFELSEDEYRELDELAKLLLDPNKNFDKILEIWNKEEKFRIMKGALN